MFYLSKTNNPAFHMNVTYYRVVVALADVMSHCQPSRLKETAIRGASLGSDKFKFLSTERVFSIDRLEAARENDADYDWERRGQPAVSDASVFNEQREWWADD